jgi:hypothetical protein
MRILLTGSRHFVALDTARRLHQQGHEVFTADSVDFEYTKYSRAVKKFFTVPSARFDPESFRDAVRHIVDAYKIDEVISLGEEIFHLSSGKLLQKLEQLHDKAAFGVLAQQIGLKTPNTIVANCPDDITRYQKHTNPNIVIKPVYSRFAGRFIHLTRVDAEAVNLLTWPGKYIVQDYITGQPISSYSLDGTGEVITYCSDTITTHPGAMANARTIATPDVVRNADAKIRAKLQFTGQLGLDFIRTVYGEYFLLEANPRATMGRLLLTRPRAQSRILMLHQLLGGHIKTRDLGRYLFNMVTYPDAVFSWRDPMPAIASQILSKGLPTYLKWRKQNPGKSFALYSAEDMEYNGASCEFLVEPAQPKDDASLINMIEALSSKNSFAIAQTRRPAPLGSFLKDAERVDVGILRYGDKVAYMAACATSRYYISGAIKQVSYISSLRKSPDVSVRLPWLKKFSTYFKEKTGTSLQYGSVMATNTAIQRQLAVGSEDARSVVVGKYNSYLVNARRYKAHSDVARDITFSRVTKRDASKLIGFLNTEGKKRDLFPVIKDLDSNLIGATVQNTFVLKSHGEIVGCAAVIDPRDRKQFVVKRYSWLLKIIRNPYNAIFPKLGYISFPELDQPVNCRVVGLYLVKDDDAQLADALLAKVSLEVAKTAEIFTIALPASHPGNGLLGNRFNFRFSSILYASAWQSGDDGLRRIGSNFYVDAAIL